MSENNIDQNHAQPALSQYTGWLSKERAQTLVLIAATAIAFYVCYRIVFPFIPSITWAMALAITGYPLNKWLVERTERPTLAAGLAVLIIGVIVIAPGIFLAQTLVRQIGKGAEAVKAQTESGQWRDTIESNPKLAAIVNRIEPYVDIRSTAEQAAGATASQVSAFVGGVLWVVAQLVITFFTLFYLFRDKRDILKIVRSFMPLSQSETDKMFSRVSNTVYATIYGSISVSLVQGLLGGLMFWWLGLPAPLLWGSVMFLLSLIPVLGAPVVWIPVSIYLALTGDWGKALILAGWGLVVIGSIDNLLYPVLVGDRVRLHPLLVFFSVIGGLALIGAAGLILGPIAVVITGMLIEVWRQRTAEDYTVEEAI
jgi:predicted PurR-regulated permease PerM